MPEQAVGYDDLMAIAGHNLGWGRDSSAWTADKTETLDELVQSAVRQVYHPPMIPGQRAPHVWSFLEIPFQIVTTEDVTDYLLPEDFGYLVGPVTIFSSSNVYLPVQVVGEARIRDLRSRSVSEAGIPREVAYRPLATTGAAGQRFELLVWPEPDDAYTLQCRYSAVAGWKLSAARPYPYGGHVHAELYRASVLAKCETDMDDVRSVKWAAFLERLSAAIEFDKRQKPEVLGFMESGEGCGYVRMRGEGGTFTYMGVTYE